MTVVVGVAEAEASVPFPLNSHLKDMEENLAAKARVTIDAGLKVLKV